jgi:hypothetical protein
MAGRCQLAKGFRALEVKGKPSIFVFGEIGEIARAAVDIDTFHRFAEKDSRKLNHPAAVGIGQRRRFVRIQWGI